MKYRCDNPQARLLLPTPVPLPVISNPSSTAQLAQHARHRLRGVGLAKLIEKATSGKLLRHVTQ